MQYRLNRDVNRVCVPLIIAAAILPLLSMSARAHDPNTHLADGYSAARSKKGDLCCDGTDYTFVAPRSWERTDKGYRVFVKGKWVDVPADALVTNMKNPDGEAKVWLYEDGNEIRARCIMPGAES